MASKVLQQAGHLQRSSFPRLLQGSLIISRSASHHAHEHHPEADTYEYRPEGFASPFWRNVAVLSVLGYGLYLVAPARVAVNGEDASITKFLASQIPDSNLWKERNAVHLALSKDAADDKWMTGTAKRPPVYRFRYTGAFDDASPHMVPTGELRATQAFDIKAEKLTRF